MADLKLEAAKAAVKRISPGQIIGLGAGSTVAHLVDLVSQEQRLSGNVTFVSSSFKTNVYLLHKGQRVQTAGNTSSIDIYFDGCDQFDNSLNALKSGGGIHTTEKILASAASDFILIGDEGKYAERLDTSRYPLVIEILPQALSSVVTKIASELPAAKLVQRMSNQKDGALISDNGNYLADIFLDEPGDLAALNIKIKMIPGIVEHSLFYNLASLAIIAGPDGIRELTRAQLS
ncbi:ribose 5-phosphate isomerase A [Pedobacter sp. JY14-1]|uniref:ribose 5-phosphate isomerase A n=1 Tax=Pedobacter sp. JY14-1 TaxID=3034151 RepID=UPI0023E1E044|nr:ribose 5-phosphate isomerase A [Pedobacter sp. JY14-1]